MLRQNPLERSGLSRVLAMRGGGRLAGRMGAPQRAGRLFVKPGRVSPQPSGPVYGYKGFSIHKQVMFPKPGGQPYDLTQAAQDRVRAVEGMNAQAREWSRKHWCEPTGSVDWLEAIKNGKLLPTLIREAPKIATQAWNRLRALPMPAAWPDVIAPHLERAPGPLGKWLRDANAIPLPEVDLTDHVKKYPIVATGRQWPCHWVARGIVGREHPSVRQNPELFRIPDYKGNAGR